jgi:hypothetical protein
VLEKSFLGLGICPLRSDLEPRSAKITRVGVVTLAPVRSVTQPDALFPSLSFRPLGIPLRQTFRQLHSPSRLASENFDSIDSATLFGIGWHKV